MSGDVAKAGIVEDPQKLKVMSKTPLRWCEWLKKLEMLCHEPFDNPFYHFQVRGHGHGGATGEKKQALEASLAGLKDLQNLLSQVALEDLDCTLAGL